jgi:PAS domain S-box-containing protein
MKTDRVLIVDDNEDNRYLLRSLLQGNGFEVATATQGVEALEVARQNPPDLVIADILMPVMDGFTLCRAWKKDERLRQVPFIFYTATYTDEQDREFGLSLGAERFIVKPEEPQAFMAIIREVLQQVQRPPARVPTQAPPQEEANYLKQYNEALIRKLEAKMGQLEQAKRALEQELDERKRAEEKLREYEKAVEGLEEMLAVVDREYRYVLANRAFLKYRGMEGQQIAGLTVGQVMGAELFEKVIKEKLDQCFAGEVVKYELKFNSPQLGVRDLSVSLFPIAGPLGVDRAAIIVQDVTDRRALETQLQRAAKMEAVGQLAGGVAHDFNNLLTIISGYSHLLHKRLGPEDLGDVEEIMKAGERAASLTRQLLAFSRKQVMVPQVLDLNVVISDLAKMLKRLIGEDIRLRTVLQPSLGSIKADPGQIEQVIMNLAVNSRDAMPSVGDLTLETSNVELDENYAHAHITVKPGPHIMLAVTDTGCGMTPETKARIFEPFFTTKEHGKGTGLGLATVYGIVKQSGGSIWVYSEPGQGTTFKIYFPRVYESPVEVTRPVARDDSAKGTETILLAEDEEGVRSLTRALLRSEGYQVLEARGPIEAISLAEQYTQPIHLLLTDVVMPKMSGKTLSNRVTALHPETKVLFMSGYTDDAIVQHGILESGVFFIQKPFTSASLAQKLREVLAAKQRGQS